MKKPSKEILDEAVHYQYILDGETISLADMDRGQLLRALMQSIDVIEKVSSSINEANERIGDWDSGRLEE